MGTFVLSIIDPTEIWTQVKVVLLQMIGPLFFSNITLDIEESRMTVESEIFGFGLLTVKAKTAKFT